MIDLLVAGLIAFNPAPMDDPTPDPPAPTTQQVNPWLSPSNQRGTCYRNNQLTTWCS